MPGGNKGDGDSGGGKGGGLGDGGGGEGCGLGGGGDGDGGGGVGGGDEGGGEGGEGGSEGGGLGGKMGCFTATDRALLLRLRPVDTAERTSSIDKLPLSRASASSAPPCMVTESCTWTLHRVLLLTLTLLALSCGISATFAVRLLSSERLNVAEVPPAPPQPVFSLDNARRRLVTNSQVV